ncbi:MAG: hypothetical protein GY850_45880 [bacterium]|nr:hypothetical protein [bacterium]
MTLETIRAVFAWCTVINFGILVFWFAFFALAHDWMYRYHCKVIKLSEETFDTIHYAGMALFKIGIFLFSLGPYLAMRIVG